jgi:hypothetical protein
MIGVQDASVRHLDHMVSPQSRELDNSWLTLPSQVAYTLRTMIEAELSRKLVIPGNGHRGVPLILGGWAVRFAATR